MYKAVPVKRDGLFLEANPGAACRTYCAIP